jgi:undecaprenyl-diphosphatase
MLVDCGGGLSFPSSHAVNNLAAATVISHYFPLQRWYWFGFASLVALSRPYVGVHYPSDIVAGGLIGVGIGFLIVSLWDIAEHKWTKRH